MSNQPMKHRHPFWALPSFFDTESLLEPASRSMEHSGLSLCEDKDHVIVEAALPGLSPNEIEITFEKGMLWIKGEKKEEEEDKKRNYYRKASRSFSYHIDVPGDLDMSQEPTAEYSNGMMTVRFKKSEKHTARQIKVRIK
ncbi:MAG: Hsp20/alpha crystallin family protein [Chlamydiae bacterium]|nr:Hsp20/alpha crystallin family protein [Chlamydiota bacterium]